MTQSADSAGTGPEIRVLLPLPLAGPYTYLAPPGPAPPPGTYVRAPLGNRLLPGVVWDGPAEPGPETARLRRVDRLPPLPALPAAARRFVDWIAAYTLSPPGAVLRMTIGIPGIFTPPAPQQLYAAGETPPGLRLTAGRRRVLAQAAEGTARTLGALAEAAGAGPAVVRGLIAAGALRPMDMTDADPAPWPVPDPARPGPRLSASQRQAADALESAARAGGFSVTLLDGVTGSGKTEVYFTAVAETLRQGRQALVLLPEIALSTDWLQRFTRRFGAAPAVWHSELGTARRRDTWRAVASGQARVVVGARSALHLPFPDLGLIVVDEEHDPSFKQEEGVIYNARDMAVVRGRLGGFPVLLASATPSLETLNNARQGRYRRLELPARHGGAAPPEMRLVDLRRDPPPRGGWISPPLRAALAETLERGEQALLFLNRRGYAPLTLCGACGHRLGCPDCDAWLVAHKAAGRMQCHHCGHSAPPPPLCPACGAADRFRPCGPGVERLAEEAGQLFPAARLALATSDTLQGPRAAETFIRQMADGEFDLVIGTQVLAKGHHFPRLTLVGVVDADLGLAGGDLRAGERSWQLLHQVAGRAGRAAALPGRALIQTSDPENPVMQALAAGDRDGFIARETAGRQAAAAPPFGRWAAVIVSAPDARRADTAAAALARAAPGPDASGADAGLRVLGPAPAPLARLRGRHRRRFLVKGGPDSRLQPALRRWLAGVRLPRDVRVRVDIDPVSFL